MEEKGLNEVIGVTQSYVRQLLNTIIATLLLPFRLVDALLD